MILGITGRARHGKDAVAKAVIHHRNTFERVSFADQLKDLALKVDPVIPIRDHNGLMGDLEPSAVEHGTAIVTARLSQAVTWAGWEFAKNNYPEVRRFLQHLGTGVRETLGEDAWVDAWELLALGKRVAPPYLTTMPYADVVVPDTRFLNEAQRIKDHRGVIIRVVRPSVGAPDTHVSETEMDEIVADYTVVNHGTLSDLVDQVADILDAIGV